MASQAKNIFLTRPDYPEESVQYLENKFIVNSYPHAKPISRDALLEGVKGVDAIYCQSTDRIDKEVLDTAGPQLKIIATMSIGFEHIDIEECKKRNIIVCNSANPLSVGAVAEMIIGLILTVGRKILDGSKVIERRITPRAPQSITRGLQIGEWTQSWSPTMCLGRGLMKAVVGVVGMGRIGLALLKRLLPFEVEKVIYFDMIHPVKSAEDLGAKFVPFYELLQSSDYVVATCNLTPQSRGLFDAKAFSCMKPTAVFINTSRGAVVNQDDLYDALKSQSIKAAALDVMYPEPLPKDHKLVSLPNVVLLPHVASAEEIALTRLGFLAASNITEVLEGRSPLTNPIS